MSPTVQPAGELAHWWKAVVATTATSFKRNNAYVINIIRTPLLPVGLFLPAYLAWQAAGVQTIDGVSVGGFLLAGMFGLVCWSSAVWWTGSAIENERYEGTIGALFLSPASRVAIVLGHGLGGLAFLIPSFAVVALLGALTGAQLNVASPAAVAAAALTLLAASLAMGFLLASFFILTRRANLMANVIQHPLFLLGGFMIPRDELPGWLHAISQAMPIAHATDAFRASMLTSASLGDISAGLLAALGTSAAFMLIGLLGLRRVEHAAKRAGQLDLF